MDRKWIKKTRNAVISAGFAAVALYCLFSWRDFSAQEEVQEVMVEIEEDIPQEPEAEQSERDILAEASDSEGYCDIAAQVGTGDEAQSIRLLVRDGSCFLFLPAYAGTGQITWQYDESRYGITCNGRLVRNGDALEADGPEAAFVVRQRGEDWETAYGLTVVRSESLPALYIDTTGEETAASGSDGDGSRQTAFLCVAEDGKKDCQGTFSEISEETYSGFAASKKNYVCVSEEEEELLGMGGARTWMLQANAFDLSRMRNKTVYDMAADMGMVRGIDSAYADVWIDGGYAGNYLVCKRALQESALLSEGERQEIICDGSTPQEQMLWQPHPAELEEIIAACSSEEDYGSLEKVIDTESFAQMFVLCALVNEPSCSGTDTLCMAQEREGGVKMYTSLTTGFDRAFGNAQGAHLEQLSFYDAGIGGRLFDCAYFRQDVKELFAGRYAPVIENYIGGGIMQRYEQIGASVRMDDIRWQYPEAHYCDFNDGYETADDAVKYLIYYLNSRYELLAQYLEEPEKWHWITYEDSASVTGYDTVRCLVREGEKVPEQVDGYLQEWFACEGWLYEDGRECETGRPVYQDMVLTARGRADTVQEEGTEPEKEEEAGEPAREPEVRQEAARCGKRFVILCMLFAAGCGGLCGIPVGWGALALFLRRKRQSEGDN